MFIPSFVSMINRYLMLIRQDSMLGELALEIEPHYPSYPSRVQHGLLEQRSD